MAVQQFEQVPGRGLKCRLAGDPLLAGNARMMEDEGIALDEFQEKSLDLANEGKTPLFFAYGGDLIGILALADALKPTSAQAIAELRAAGIFTVMLTGDNNQTAQAIQKHVQVDQVISNVLPKDKEEAIRTLSQQGSVAMVGDGINDAPALARADVGIAIGAGTDVAIDSADIVLIKSDLMDVVAAIQLSAATLKRIRWGLFWALIYNVICIPIAAGALAYWGFSLNPMIAAAAMSCSSLCVVANALRLRNWKPEFKGEE